MLGPTIVAAGAAESPLVQPDLYARQTPPVINLSAVVFFAVGLGIVRAHPWWQRDWTVSVTLTGWGFVVRGALRMSTATGAQIAVATEASRIMLATEAALILWGAFLTWHGWKPAEGR